MNSAQPADRTPDDQLPAEPATAVAGRPTDGDAPDASGAGRVQLVVPSAMRAQRSTRDIVISLLVLLVPIALLIGFGRVFLGADQPTGIDPAPAVEQARSANTFPVSEVTGLPEGWHTVTADFRRGDTGSTLRIGYLSPDGGGVQLVQSSVPAEQLLPVELTRAGQPHGTVDLGGGDWQRYSARPGEGALVLLEPGRTVLVVGRVSETDLRRIALSLR